MANEGDKAMLVKAEWDDEAGVWVAQSDDVPGLVAEAPTIEHLLEKLRVLIPELLELNDFPSDSDSRLTAGGGGEGGEGGVEALFVEHGRGEVQAPAIFIRAQIEAVGIDTGNLPSGTAASRKTIDAEIELGAILTVHLLGQSFFDCREPRGVIRQD